MSFTIETFNAGINERDLARAIFFQGVSNYRDYLAECEEERRMGYRPSHCRHGANLWVDYDCACGLCEDEGNYWHDSREWERAKWFAADRVAQLNKRYSLMMALIREGMEFNAELVDWIGNERAGLKRYIEKWG